MRTFSWSPLSSLSPKIKEKKECLKNRDIVELSDYVADLESKDVVECGDYFSLLSLSKFSFKTLTGRTMWTVRTLLEKEDIWPVLHFPI